MTAPDDVLSFWYGDGDRNDPALAMARVPIWFGHDAQTDATILEQFVATLEDAAAGRLEDWAKTPRGRLALVIVLDQFSRNAFRSTPRMFAQDARALAHARAAIDAGEDRELAVLERMFMYMPFEHAEDRDLQPRCVELFRGLVDAAPEAARPQFQGYVGYAERHLAIIDRFGRFPHRNAVLGRASTPEEVEFLTQPGSSF